MSSNDRENPPSRNSGEGIRGSLRFFQDPVFQLIAGEIIVASIVLGALNIHRQPELRQAIITGTLLLGTALAVYEVYRERHRHKL